MLLFNFSFTSGLSPFYPRILTNLGSLTDLGSLCVNFWDIFLACGVWMFLKDGESEGSSSMISKMFGYVRRDSLWA